jgi:hypothetical protein
MSLIGSARVSEYVIEDWCGLEDNPVLFTCYSQDEIDDLLARAGFVERNFLRVTSAVYEQMPRLVERGVRIYQVLARNA